ncbi:MAG: hypothetical protein R3E97_14695 [Candidatus Eisenbacteria bacterium]
MEAPIPRETVEESTGRSRLFRGFLAFLYLASLAGIVAFLVRGWDYYSTPYALRPQHADYEFLRPAGLWGQGFGVIGTVLMLLLFLYSWRKRSRTLGKVGKTRQWLSLHIYCGVIGPLLIVLHSSFKVTGLVAVSFWAMVAVALSGVFGRYLYQRIPRTVLGQAMAPDEIRIQELTVDRQLREQHAASDEFLEGLQVVARGRRGFESAVLGVMAAAAQEMTVKRRLTRYLWARQEWRDAERDRRPGLEELCRQKTQVHARLHRLEQYQTAFHYWHVIHKPFAAIMVLVMGIHIGIAIAFGYRWIF